MDRDAARRGSEDASDEAAQKNVGDGPRARALAHGVSRRKAMVRPERVVNTEHRRPDQKQREGPEVNRERAERSTGEADAGADPEPRAPAQAPHQPGCPERRPGATDDEAYFAIPGPALPAVEERLAVMVKANQELEKFHRGRLPRA